MHILLNRRFFLPSTKFLPIIRNYGTQWIKSFYLLLLTVFFEQIDRDMSMPGLTIDDMPVIGEQVCGQCSRVYAPVCAYDNKTYVNECKLHCVNQMKKKRKRYHVKFYGPCMPFRRYNNYMFIHTPNDTVYERMVLVENETVLQDVLDLKEMAQMEYVSSFDQWKYLVNEDLVMAHSDEEEL